MTYTSLEDAMRYLIEAKPQTTIRQIPARKTQPANSIEKLLNEKVECLATILRDIQHKIDKRYVLSCDVIGLIDQHYRYIKTKFFELRQWPLGSDRAIDTQPGLIDCKEPHRTERLQNHNLPVDICVFALLETKNIWCGNDLRRF